MKKIFSKYGGVLIGSLYGLIMRILFDVSFKNGFDFVGLFSISFVWIVPIIIGITPILFSSKEQLSSITYQMGTPVLTVLLFFCFCFITQLEDLVCLVVIAIPFLFGAALGGVLVSQYILKYRKRKGIIYSVFLIPFLFGFLEEQIPSPTKISEIKTSVIINATAEKVWSNVIRVNPIDECEYRKGFFNYAGIPRPLYAELDKDTIGAIRIGHFEGGLTFQETVTKWEKNKAISFNIKVIPSSIRKTIFDQHILKGDHFKFLNASYSIKKLRINQVELTLSSTYQLDTKINLYGSFWGDKLLMDFQDRLLEVINNRCSQDI